MALVDGSAVHLARLDELVDLVQLAGPLYVRYSAGPRADAEGTSVDGESGTPLPGLSANRLQPEPWWTRPAREWVARQLAQYAHLGTRDARIAWVLSGVEVGRGPDSEPLLADVTPVALLDGELLAEALTVYREAFQPGRLPSPG